LDIRIRRLRPQAKRQTVSLLALLCLALLLCLVFARVTPEQTQAALAPVSTEVTNDVSIPSFPLLVTEIMASNRSVLADENGDFSDWIELTNQSSEPVNLDGLGISDDPSAVKLAFPAIILQPGQRLLVFASGVYRAEADAPLHAPFALSSAGESVCLFTADGVLVSEVAFPALERDQSWALQEDGAGRSAGDAPVYAASAQPSPGYPNTAQGFEAFRSANSILGSDILLNEIMAVNRSAIRDEDGDYSDYIEIYNPHAYRVDLTGYGLSDDETSPMKWRFPQGVTIPANGTLLVFASGKNRGGAAADSLGGTTELHTSFKLDATRETVLLSNAKGQLLDRTILENLGKDEVWMRPAGMTAWQVSTQATPGYPNDRSGLAAADAKTRQANAVGVYISEAVVYSTGLETPYGRTSYDWVELYNASAVPVNLKDWGLSDKPGRPRLYQMPDVTIEPGGFLLVFCSGLTEPPKGSKAIHATIRLSALGGVLTLCTPDGTIIDRMAVPALEENTSYGRTPGEAGFYYYDTPTPGAANEGGVAGYAVEPVPDVPGGVYDGSVTVTFTLQAGDTVRYTLDGGDPTPASAVYEGPITLTETAVLRARSFSAGLRPSPIVTATYFVNTYHTLPLISLVTDPDNLWNPVTGIYAGDYTQSSRTKVAYDDLPYWKKLRVAGHFEFFETDGLLKVSEDVELGLHGQYSLDIPQKSFRVTAKARYGSTELPYAFFPDRPYTTYQSLVIRNGGNDGKYTRIVDGFQSRIVDWADTTLYHMPVRPVIVFLNGAYWGQYNIRERVNVHSLARFEGWSDPDAIDLIKADKNVLNGSYDNYGQLLDFVKTHDLANDSAALETVTDWVDIENYFDYMIFEMYFGNTDTGNIKFYRRQAPGEKWKWVLFDLDWGMFNSQRDGCKIWLDPDGTGTMNFDNTLIRKLLTVPALRDQFLRRFGQLYREVFDTQRMLDLAHSMADAIRVEMPMHFSRWAPLNNSALDIDAPTNAEGALAYWENQLGRLDNVIRKRNYYIWGYVQSWFGLSESQMVDYFGPREPLPAS